MSEPDPNPISDKVLRSYAEKRRQEIPETGLNPVDRENLLAEVRRLYKPQRPRSRRGFWFKFAFAGPAFALLLLGFWIRETIQMAPKTTPQAAQAPQENQMAHNFAESAVEQDADMAASAPAPEPPAAPQRFASAVRRGDMEANEPQSDFSMGEPPPPPAITMPTNAAAKEKPLYKAEALSKAPLPNRQEVQFRAAPRAPRSRQNFVRETHNKAESDVLREFTLVTSGKDVTLTDGDGSVYKGSFQAATISTESKAGSDSSFGAKAELASTLPATPASEEALPSVMEFTATGTNLTLQKTVRVEGLLIEGTPESRTDTQSPERRVTGRIQLENAPPEAFEALESSQ